MDVDACDPPSAVGAQDAEYVAPPVGGGDVDELMTVADVPVEGAPEDIIGDPTIRVRSLSKRALILEAASHKHQQSHFPHNPFASRRT